MSDHTKIEWADATVNAVNGCSVVSPGCTNCYAMRLAGTRMKHHPSRAGLTIDSKAGPVWSGEVRLSETALLQPLRWKRPRRIFWNAHGDLFHDAVPDAWTDRVFAVCALTPRHTHMILTKRSARMREYVSGFGCDGARRFHVLDQMFTLQESPDLVIQWPLPNVWLGVSVEDQARADERIPDLLATPAAIRFISAEPLLGPIDLDEAWHGENALESACWGDCAWCELGHPPLYNCQKGKQSEAEVEKNRCGLDWVIAGGESGPRARPMHPDWARGLRDQCAAARVAFHFKQNGEFAPGEIAADYLNPEKRAKGLELFDGRWIECWSEPDGHCDDEPDVYRLGKKRAGRLLDGVTHDGVPA